MGYSSLAVLESTQLSAWEPWGPKAIWRTTPRLRTWCLNLHSATWALGIVMESMKYFFWLFGSSFWTPLVKHWAKLPVQASWTESLLSDMQIHPTAACCCPKVGDVCSLALYPYLWSKSRTLQICWNLLGPWSPWWETWLHLVGPELLLQHWLSDCCASQENRSCSCNMVFWTAAAP